MLLKIDFGKGFGFWKTIPIRWRISTGIHVGGVDVLPFEEDLPLDAGPVDQIVHPVEKPQQRRLAAAGGTDEGGDPVFFEIQGDVGQRPEAAVEEIDILRS